MVQAVVMPQFRPDTPPSKVFLRLGNVVTTAEKTPK
jgi:hypothetical protein